MGNAEKPSIVPKTDTQDVKATAEVVEEIHCRTPSHHSTPAVAVCGDADFVNAPWQYKALALITALMLPVGAHFSGSTLGAMKTTLKQNLHIDNTKYGVLSSAVSIINTVLPIAGGVFIDTFGTLWGTMGVSAFIVVGSLLTALAAKLQSFPVMIVGRVIFGIGSGMIVTMQESLLSKWFRTENLAIAIGVQLSISRLATFLGTLVANPMAKRMNDWAWAFWLSFILCCFSMVMNVVYALVVTHLNGTLKGSHGNIVIKAKTSFRCRSVVKFPLIFWFIITIEFLYSAVWSSFQTISTELIQIHFGTKQMLAAYQASASQIVPIIGTPLLGVFMDLFGLRLVILLLSAVFLILSTALLGWTYVNAVVGMVFYSISLAFGPIAMITSIAMVLPSDYIGTGLGIYKSSNNVGTTILDILVGVVQDKTADHSYSGVMIIYLVLSCLGALLIIGLWITQKMTLGNLLQLSRKKRLVRMQAIYEHEQACARENGDALQDVRVQFVNLVFLFFFFAAIVVAWVLFFVYATSGGPS